VRLHISRGTSDEGDALEGGKMDQSLPADAPPCRFCPENIQQRVVAEVDSVWAIRDEHPVTEGHHLIIPRRHSVDWFSMTEKERRDADALILILKRRIVEEDPAVTGFNIGVNCGESAGQSVFHAHIHLIPRRSGDTPHPRGGVRGVIPGKMDYPRR
jgi:diadenosine tetraphosphate (Ap4A) HIT family hydrolase